MSYPIFKETSIFNPDRSVGPEKIIKTDSGYTIAWVEHLYDLNFKLMVHHFDENGVSMHDGGDHIEQESFGSCTISDALKFLEEFARNYKGE